MPAVTLVELLLATLLHLPRPLPLLQPRPLLVVVAKSTLVQVPELLQRQLLLPRLQVLPLLVVQTPLAQQALDVLAMVANLVVAEAASVVEEDDSLHETSLHDLTQALMTNTAEKPTPGPIVPT